MIYWYDRTGKVIADSNDDHDKHMADMQKVEKLLGDPEYKVINQEFTPRKKFQVSTVWLGLDHSFSSAGLDKRNPHPIIFETMVFKKGDRGEDVLQRRYSTEEEAIAGHQKIYEEFAKWEWEHSIPGRIAKAWRAFWQKKASWNRAFGYAFAAGWLASFASYAIPKDGNHTLELAVLDAFTYATMFAWITHNIIEHRKHKKQLREDVFELKVRSIIMEHELRAAGEEKAAASIEKSRKEILNKL